MARRTLPRFFLLFAILAASALAQDVTVPAEDPIKVADKLFAENHIEEAARRYKAVLTETPSMCHARAALMRARLRQQRVDEAYELGDAGLDLPDYTAELIAAIGDVEFRRGEIADAEASYKRALEMDGKEIHAHLGLAKLYRASSMYRLAYEQLNIANEIAPSDAEVKRALWIRLPRKQRVDAMDAYVSTSRPTEVGDSLLVRQSANNLRATLGLSGHPCRLVNKVEQTQIPLMVVRGVTALQGFGLLVEMNGHPNRLLLDTGSSGILIGHRAADVAGVERIATQTFGGIGGKESLSGYAGLAKHIRIGELEFEDCVVHVLNQYSAGDNDGIFGTDVLGDYLIDIDGPKLKLRLSPLPARPDEPALPIALQTDNDPNEGEYSGALQEGERKPELNLPQNRYVAPEMEKWTRALRFGHQLLIPTKVNNEENVMFAIDTGSFVNMISVHAGHHVSKVRKDPQMRIKNMNGNAAGRVYSAEHVKLQFGRIARQEESITAIDFNALSGYEGTEFSGLLGFPILSTLETKIDYRDGLVDFSFDPTRFSPLGQEQIDGLSR